MKKNVQVKDTVTLIFSEIQTDTQVHIKRLNSYLFNVSIYVLFNL